MFTVSISLTTLGSLLLLSGTHAAKSNATNTIRLLTLVPFFDSRPHAGWDRGLELLPMARIAKDEINQREDILPGYELELIEASSDACGYPTISTALVNFASNAIGLSGESNILGVTGLVCSTVTANVSPLAGREAVSLVQLSMANSPDLGNSSKYPHLWRTVSSSVVLINATLALMELFNWNKIATLHDQNGINFLDIDRKLVDQLKKTENQTILDIAIDESEDYIDLAVQQIQTNGTRIIVVSGTPLESALIMCAAARKKLTWPGYQWIFYSSTFEDFLSNLNDLQCEMDEVLDAMENVILLQWQLAPDDFNTTVYSGKTVQELQELYFEELKSLTEEEQYSQYVNEFSFKAQSWAYPLYDEVWAFALALNNALSDLEALNISLTDYHIGNKIATQILETHLANLSFQGIVGHVSFDIHHESSTSLKIYQVRNGTEVLIGGYSKLEGLVLYNSSDVIIVNDELEEDFLQISLVLRVVFYLMNIIIILIITSLLALTVFYRRSKVIKANSTLLTSLVFFGCYGICFSTLAHTLLLETGISAGYYTVLCNIHFWCFELGMTLILGTNLVKLIRIFWIFTHIQDSGRLLTNCALFTYDLLLGIFPVLLLLLWSLVDPLHYEQEVLFHLDHNPPYIEYVVQCTCQWLTLWNGLGAVYITIILWISIFFAFRTRKIKLGDFKDTKKIIFLVLFLTLSIICIVSLIVIFGGSGERRQVYVSMIWIVGNSVICLFCMGFLIAPKALPVFYEHLSTGKYASAPTRRTFSHTNLTIKTA